MFKKVWRWNQALTILLDAVLINVGFLLAYWLRYELQWFREVEPIYYVPFKVYGSDSLWLMAVLLAVYLIEGLYQFDRGRGIFDEAMLVLRGTLTGTGVFIVLSLFLRTSLRSRLIYVYALVVIVILLTLMRIISRAIMSRLRKRGMGVDRVLVVGAGEAGRAVMRNIAARPELGYHLVGFVDDAPEKSHTDLGRIKALGDSSQIPDLLHKHHIDEVIITLPWMSHRKMLSICDQCRREHVVAKIVPDLFQLRLSQVDIDDIDGVPLIGLKESTIQGWNRAVKRVFDLIGATLGLIVLAPLLGVLALWIKLDSPGSVIFRQTRIGRDGEPFTVLKFRTMYEGADHDKTTLLAHNESDGPLFKMRNDPRRTRIGKWLRRSSLDELPQLINVLRGEMSLVGPRPAVPEEVAQYTPWHRRRLEVSPGLTGLAQVSGRSELAFEEGVLMDLYYIENWNMFLEMKILLRTIPTAILGRGAF